jgi:hypothetical protein
MFTSRLKTFTTISSAVLFLGSFTIVEAGIPLRQERQQNRIYQGVRSGQLTRREFRGLEREQYRIQRNKQRFKSDGNFTPQERARIQRQLNRASRDIYRQKHDNQKR